SGVDVRSRERHVVETPLDLDVAEESDDRRQFDGEGDPVNIAVVLADDFHLALEQQGDRLLPVDDLQWLLRCVQKERVGHVSAPWILPERCRGVKKLDRSNALKRWWLAPLW